jgi:uncharacterized membrane protein YgaE (UPF0421/DUF939 family)
LLLSSGKPAILLAEKTKMQNTKTALEILVCSVVGAIIGIAFALAF